MVGAEIQIQSIMDGRTYNEMGNSVCDFITNIMSKVHEILFNLEKNQLTRSSELSSFTDADLLLKSSFFSLFWLIYWFYAGLHRPTVCLSLFLGPLLS